MIFNRIICSSCLFIGTLAAAITTGDSIPWGSLRCPKDDQATLPTPTYGTEERVFMICTELVIQAPWETIYETLIDFRRYHLWNSFVVDVVVPDNVKTPKDVYIGLDLVFTTVGLISGANTTSDEVVTVLDHGPHAGYEMAAWRSNAFLNGSLSRAEHPSILSDAGHGQTRYVSYETYYEGPATSLIFEIRPQLQTQFDQQGQDLKTYVEGLKY